MCSQQLAQTVSGLRWWFLNSCLSWGRPLTTAASHQHGDDEAVCQQTTCENGWNWFEKVIYLMLNLVHTWSQSTANVAHSEYYLINDSKLFVIELYLWVSVKPAWWFQSSWRTLPLWCNRSGTEWRAALLSLGFPSFLVFCWHLKLGICSRDIWSSNYEL